MRHSIIFFLLLTTTAFCQYSNDSIAVVRLLMSDYKTLGNWDIYTHIENCTENYLLVENGEIWNIAKEMEYFKANANRVIDRKDSFDYKHVRISGKLAYAVYHLKSEIQEDGKLKIKTWMETAILRKVKGKWKIELIHSTPIQLQSG